MKTDNSIYEKYLASIQQGYLNQITHSAKHQETIVRFGREIANFHVSPSICVSHVDGALSLLVTCWNDKEVGDVMNQLMLAGFKVEEPRKNRIQYGNCTRWIAQVSGRDLIFDLHFSIEHMEQPA